MNRLMPSDWTACERDKARYMIRRGRTDEQVAAYMGMPLELVAKLRAQDTPLCGGEHSRRATPTDEPLGIDCQTAWNRNARLQDRDFVAKLQRTGGCYA